MAAARASHFWRLFRRVFRWCRITLLLAILGAILGALWVNRIGLPKFLKTRFLAELRTQGVDLNFTRMRLHWQHGIVAEQIRLASSKNPEGAAFTASEAELRIRIQHLLDPEVRIEGLTIRGGRAVLSVRKTNAPVREMQLERVSGKLLFLPRDVWELDLHARMLGARMSITGFVTNGSFARKWQLADPTAPKEGSTHLYDFISNLQQMRLSTNAEMLVEIRGDARQPKSFRFDLKGSTPDVATPWGTASNLLLSLQVGPGSNQQSVARFRFKAASAQTEWGAAQALSVGSYWIASQWPPSNGHLTLRIREAEGKWGHCDSLHGSARVGLDLTNGTLLTGDYTLRAENFSNGNFRLPSAGLKAQAVQFSSNLWPVSVDAQVQARRVATPWGTIGRATANGSTISQSSVEDASTNHSWKEKLLALPLDFDGHCFDLTNALIVLDSVAFSGQWGSPDLRLNQLKAELYGGDLTATGSVQTETRTLSLHAASNFQLQPLSPLLSTNIARWLTNIACATPPRLETDLKYTLPPWTNSLREWKQQLPSLVLDGKLHSDALTIYGVQATGLESTMLLSNLVWTIPALQIQRPEGAVNLTLITDIATEQFQGRVASDVDLRSLKPGLNKEQQRALNDFTFSDPPRIQTAFLGCWDEPGHFSFDGTVAATNFTFRGQSVKSLTSLVIYTNNAFRFIAPEIQTSNGVGRAAEVKVDIATSQLYLHDGISSLEVQPVLKALGRYAVRAIAPYQFGNPPQVSVNGVINWENEKLNDLHFNAAGGPFQWLDFVASQIQGDIHWKGPSLTITNVNARFYEGDLNGAASFKFREDDEADFAFSVAAQNVNLHSFMGDIYTRTNTLEGRLTALLTVTNGNTADALSWQGMGNLSLRDGRLWEVPVLAVFSPILDRIAPGIGKSQAKEALATFSISNSVIQTTDLEVRASGMRLYYDGTIDFEHRMQGKLEAALFRDMPGVGLLLSKLMWPVTKVFEYKMSGTLANPRAEPLYLPKIFLMPFHPARATRELGPDERGGFFDTKELPTPE